MPRLTRYYFEKQFEPYAEVISEYASSSAVFKVGDTLNHFGDPLDTVFYIKSGIFKVAALTDTGEEVTTAFYGPGSLYPPKRRGFNFSIENFFRFEAVTPIEALLMPVKQAERMFLAHPEMALAAIDSRTLELNLYSARLIQTSISAKSRVCNFLYLFYTDLNSPRLPLSQQDAASMTGLSRVQVAREYQTLRDDGVIEIGHRNVRILDPEELKKRCTRLLVP